MNLLFPGRSGQGLYEIESKIKGGTGALGGDDLAVLHQADPLLGDGSGAAFDFGFYLVKTLAGAAREQEVHHGTYYR